MQVQLVRANVNARQLEEIVSALTPPMRRVCRHMADAALQEMIGRMAMQQLADEERRRAARCGRRSRASAAPRRTRAKSGAVPSTGERTLRLLRSS
jgi:hypothetical protein